MTLQVFVKTCFCLLTKGTIFEYPIPAILLVRLAFLSQSFLLPFIFLKTQHCQKFQIVFHASLSRNKFC